jgi:hypothetical protein
LLLAAVVPGLSGLDDATQVVVENPGPGTTRLYTYLRDELGSVVGLIAEDESPSGAEGAPPLPVRYVYSPYGEAMAETGPELPEIPAPPVLFEHHLPLPYETFEASADAVGGRFPGGQSMLFQGLWTDPVLGLSYARARPTVRSAR